MPELTYLSLGWDVQSFTLAAMFALGELPPINLAIHADTGHEAQGTYDHARKWTPWLEKRGLSVVTVQPTDNRVIRTDWSGSVMIPAFTASRDDESSGHIRRQCTGDWKISPSRRYVRSLLGRGQPALGAVRCIMGISLDEWTRMRTADVAYIENSYPLVDMRMTRMDCITWLESHSLDTPPKSACTFCPYHNRAQWQAMKREGGFDWEDALEKDKAIRNSRQGFDLYVHSSRLPLEKAVRIPEDVGAQQLELDMEMPCDGGVCFV